MTTIKHLLILALCGAALPAPAAHAATVAVTTSGALPCSQYLAGFAAGDAFVLNLAASLAERLIASSWSSPAMEREQGMGADAKGRRELVLRQLQRNCQAVPSQDVQSIVGVLTRSSGR